MKLSRREKYAVIAAGFFIFLFILMRLVVSPFMEKKERLEKSLQTKTKILAEMLVLKSEYNSLKKNAELSKVRFAQRPPGFTLFSFLDKLAGDVGIKQNISYMKPSKSDQKDSQFKLSAVEMKIQGINMKQLTPYLYMIETSKNSIFLKRISITKKGEGEKGFIDVVLQVETYET